MGIFNLGSGADADTAGTLAAIASNYYEWSNLPEHKNSSRRDFPRYNEAVDIGEELYKKGGKRAMLKAYEKAEELNPGQIWIISKFWDGIGDPDGELEDIWQD